MGHLSKRVLQRLLRFGFTLDHLGKSLREQFFALNGILSGSRNNFMTRYFNKPYLKVAGFYSFVLFWISQDKLFKSILLIWKKTMLPSVFRNSHGAVLLLLSIHYGHSDLG